MLRCRKINHPWNEMEKGEPWMKPKPFGGRRLPVVAYKCPGCDSERYDEFRLNGLLNARNYWWNPEYEELNKSLREQRVEGEPRSQGINRIYLMERGLIKAPPKRQRQRQGA